MNFQTHCNHYLQRIRHTLSDPNATPELSLHPHLQAFLEDVTTDAACFNEPNITFTHEPRSINQIGRPDFIASDGLLTIGYIDDIATLLQNVPNKFLQKYRKLNNPVRRRNDLIFFGGHDIL